MTAAGVPPPDDVLLEVRGLKTYFKVMDGTVPAVDGVDFSLRRGETLGLVGESGSGKSVTSLSIMRLIERPGEIVGGEVWFEGRDLLKLSNGDMEDIRGNEITMIFQEPMTSLNPVFTVGEQIAESVRLHRHASKKDAWDRAIEMLKLVGIPSPERRVKQYPHEMSGGMRQRVVIAMALACDPKLIIADEPTTALDVTIQAQILELMKRIQAESGAAMLLITHDLAVIAETVERVAVMYAGKIVESGAVEDTLLQPTAPVHRGTADLDPVARRPRPAPERDQGHGSQPVPAAEGLPVRAALPVQLRAVQGQRACRSSDRPRSPRPLLPARAVEPAGRRARAGGQRSRQRLMTLEARWPISRPRSTRGPGPGPSSGSKGSRSISRSSAGSCATRSAMCGPSME